MHGLIVAVIAWGVLAFGSVYPWAYWPLAAAAAAAGCLSLLVLPMATPLDLRPLNLTLGLFGAAVAVQLAPLDAAWVERVSVHTLEVARSFDLAAASGPARHPLSIAPLRTATALALFISWSLLAVATARLASLRGPRGIATAVTFIGVLVALVAIVQQPVYRGRIYGFWTPRSGLYPFGPFVNKNHFAGWMMMALPVTLGLLAGTIARTMRRVQPSWRARLLWLSSPEASRLLMIAGGAAVMALSLVLTLSRSAIAATIGAVALAGMVSLRRQAGKTRRAVLTTYVLVLVVAVGAWVGFDTLVRLFARADWSTLNSRLDPWSDAVDIAARFPLAGTGLNTYSVATLFFQERDLARYYSAAHNDYLQLVAEGGWLLAIPVLLTIGALAITIRRRFRQETSVSGYWIRVGAVTGLIAIAVQELVEFSLQMPGNAVLFAVLCGVALHASPQRRPSA